MKKLLGLSMFLILSACNSKAPLLQAPPENFATVEQSIGQAITIPEPKVNILFVIDNSGSMKALQNKMITNFDIFADKFVQNTRIDYKIGVVPVYDSRYLDDKQIYPRVGQRKMNSFARLVPLKDKDNKTLNVPPYVTRETPDAKSVLKNTLNLGVQWGPEAEELLSPVLGVLNIGDELGGVYAQEQKAATQNNAGFYDKDAYLVIVFLTDAEDATDGVSSYEFYQRLLKEKNMDKNKIIIAAALSDPNKKSDTCTLDGKGPVEKIQKLLAYAGGILLDICSDNFGTKLAQLGQSIVSRVAEQKFTLPYIPDANLILTYGSKDTPEDKRQVIPNDPMTGFSLQNDFSLNQTTITLSPNLKITRVDGGQFFIRTKRVKMANLQNGRLTIIGSGTTTSGAKKEVPKKK